MFLSFSAHAEGEWSARFDTLKSEFASPFTTQAQPVLLAGSATTLLLATAFRYNLVDDTQKEFQRNKPLGDASDFGDLMGQLIPNVLYVGGQAAYGKWGGSHDGYRRAILMTKATAYASVVTLALKNIVREERPNKGDRLSFPSGHSTTAFAFASVAAAEHSLIWGIGAYSLAAFVALSRLNDNEHYLHDVVGGATIGTSFGLGLYYLQKPTPKDSKDSKILILPTKDGFTTTATWNFP